MPIPVETPHRVRRSTLPPSRQARPPSRSARRAPRKSLLASNCSLRLIPGSSPSTMGECWAMPMPARTGSDPPIAGRRTFRSTSPTASQGRGIGRGLYEALFERLRAQRFRIACAGITLPNEASVALHEQLGFVPVGVFRRYRLEGRRLARRRLVAARPGAGSQRSRLSSHWRPARRSGRVPWADVRQRHRSPHRR